MKKLIRVCLLLCLVSPAAAQEPAQQVLRVYDWSDLMSKHPFPNSQIVFMDGMSVLKIENTNNSPLEISVLTITNPSVIKKADSISCEVKYENVGKFITDSGVTEYLSGQLTLSICRWPLALGGDESTNATWFDFGGTANWQRRDLQVEHSDSAYDPPIKQLELKLRLPGTGTGTIYLRPIKLIGVASTWWSPQQSALMGGIGGSLIGCLGALIGILASMGKARRFVLATTVILIVVGIFMVIGGIVAVAMKQPYAVWYPLLLGGAILTFVLSINLYSIKRRYDDLEIRRMTSIDATGR
jgi:hypothetical protein